MSSSASAPSATIRAGTLIWEGVWGGNDINIVISFCCTVAYLAYASQHAQLLIAAVVAGLVALRLLWLAVATRSTLRAAR